MCFHTRLVGDVATFKQDIHSLKQSSISLRGCKPWQLLPRKGALQHLLVTKPGLLLLTRTIINH